MPIRLPLKVDDTILVRTGDAEDDVPRKSSVEGVAADEMLIRWPTVDEDRIPVQEHQILTISFVRGQMAYEFEAKVLNKSENPIALLVVRPCSPIRTIQRRNDIRVHALVPVELAAKVVGIAHFRRVHSSVYPIRTLTATISGGGFAIHHKASILPGTHFTVRLDLPGDRSQSLNATARVVRCEALDTTEVDSAQFEVGFEFTRISEAARARIVRFVFSVQRAGRLTKE